MTVTTVESPGRTLRDKRLQKQMSVADAARLTHIRPDRIIDLEKDDYSNFPSLSYARGFLLIYARLLGLDVSVAAARLENSNPVDIEEYEYLSGKPAPLTRSLGVGRRVFSIIFVIACIFAAFTAFVWHVLNSASRLDDFGQFAQKDQQSLHSNPSPSSTPALQTPAPQSAPIIAPVPAASAVPVAGATPVPPLQNDVVVRPLKKTWIKIQKDGDDTTPIYEDWLYPDAAGLKLHGKKFWIKVTPGGDVEILKNGRAVPYASPGIVVE